jgi:hypothetical protein
MKPTRLRVSGILAALLTVGLALTSAACTSANGHVQAQPTARSTSWGASKIGAAPPVPKFAVHLTIDGKRVPAPNMTRSVAIKIGRPARFSASIDRASGVLVRDVYLFVNNGPWTDAAPSGRVKILTQRAAALPAGESVEATWTPTPLFGTDKLHLTVRFAIGSVGIAAPLANLQLMP